MAQRSRQIIRGGLAGLAGVGLLALTAVAPLGCTEDQRKSLKHTQSGLIGLKRRVTTTIPGQETRVWEGRFKVEIGEGGFFYSFINDEGHEVKVPVEYSIVEEID